ncbi:hypothetical protein [Scytonema hofmannii]|nr:hypothetical protein [Scytonema hofmannii]
MPLDNTEIDLIFTRIWYHGIHSGALGYDGGNPKHNQEKPLSTIVRN